MFTFLTDKNTGHVSQRQFTTTPPEGPLPWILRHLFSCHCHFLFTDYKAHSYSSSLWNFTDIALVYVLLCPSFSSLSPHLVWLFFGFALLVSDCCGFHISPWPVSGFPSGLYYELTAHVLWHNYHTNPVCYTLNVIAISILAPRLFLTPPSFSKLWIQTEILCYKTSQWQSQMTSDTLVCLLIYFNHQCYLLHPSLHYSNTTCCRLNFYVSSPTVHINNMLSHFIHFWF